MHHLAPLLCATLALSASPPVSARAQAELLDIRCGSLEQLLPDSRDAGLRRALKALDDRLLELAREAGDADAAAALESLLPLLGKPLRLRLGLSAEVTPMAPPPLYLSLVVSGLESAQIARTLEDLDRWIGEALGATPQVGARRPGWRALASPVGQLVYGSEQAEDGLQLRLELGAVPPAQQQDALPWLHPAPPALSARLNLGAASELFAMMADQQDLELGYALLPFFTMAGTKDADPLSIGLSLGHDSGSAHATLRVSNYASMARHMGSLVREPLRLEHLALVPADATMASIARSDPSAFLASMRAMPEGEDMVEMLLEELESAAGLHLEHDLLDHLGTVSGMYTSDSTGGGGLLSMVLFLELKDPEAFTGTLGQLEDLVQALGAGQADGNLSLRHWDQLGARCTSLIFPGLPIPIEPCVAIQDGWLFAAASPQALAGALAQAARPDAGLLACAAFREAGGGDATGCLSIQFQDSPRFAAGGYGLASLASAALANAVRSRTHSQPEAGMLLPGYHELLAGARPSLTLGRLDGDDLVSESRADSSLMLSAAALLGSPWGALLPILASGVGMTAFSEMRSAPFALGYGYEYDFYDYADPAAPHLEPVDAETARLAKTAMQQIGMAIEMYRLKNAGRHPDSLEELLTPDPSGARFIQSLPVDPWGAAYQYVPPSGEEEQAWLYSLGQDSLPGGVGRAADIFHQP